MQYQLKKLTKQHSTKAERIFAQILMKYRVPFQAKVKIKGREIDFILKGRYAVEIDNHPQDPEKNKLLIKEGLRPYHLLNREVKSPVVEEWIRTL